MSTLHSRAAVETDAPARFAKQLLSHLGRKVEFRTDGAMSTAEIGPGTGRVTVGESVLILDAEGPDTAALEVVQRVLGKHLERFGQRSGLTVTWSSAT